MTELINERVGEYFKRQFGVNIPECGEKYDSTVLTELIVLTKEDYSGKMFRMIDITKKYLQKLDTELGCYHIVNNEKVWLGLERNEFMPVLKNLVDIMMVINFG